MKNAPNPDLDWSISYEAVKLIAFAEAGSNGPRLKSYLCPAKVWTIGWGETANVRQGMTCTKEQADMWLCSDLTERSRAVRQMCTIEPNENQLGALVSLGYNIGVQALKTSIVLKAHNRGDHEAASNAFRLFNKARVNGILQVLDGLTSRRAAEAALYLTPDEGAPHAEMPQAVSVESSLVKSPITQASVTTIGIGSLTVIKDMSETLSGVSAQIAGVAASFNVEPTMALGGLLVGAGLVGLYFRFKQRLGGWA